MPANPGFAVTVWTARVAVAFYATRVLADAADVGPLATRRRLWTAGLTFFLAHVAAAFAFVHAWSHVAAYRETARQTAALTGLDWGGGLWVNYAFALLWAADSAAWWVVGPGYPQRFRRTYLAVQVAFAFLMFNATAIFGPPLWRPVVAAFGLAVAGALILRVRRNSRGARAARTLRDDHTADAS